MTRVINTSEELLAHERAIQAIEKRLDALERRGPQPNERAPGHTPKSEAKSQPTKMAWYKDHTFDSDVWRSGPFKIEFRESAYFLMFKLPESGYVDLHCRQWSLHNAQMAAEVLCRSLLKSLQECTPTD